MRVVLNIALFLCLVTLIACGDSSGGIEQGFVNDNKKIHYEPESIDAPVHTVPEEELFIFEIDTREYLYSDQEVESIYDDGETWPSPELSYDRNRRTVTVYTTEYYDYKFDIEWGDGTAGENITQSVTHTYAVPGKYIISISGKYPRPSFYRGQLTRVLQWGAIRWDSFRSAFEHARGTIEASDAPDLSNVTDMARMFAFGTSISADISNWDVSSVTDMNRMFEGKELFNQDISNWDVSSVTDMSEMFHSAESFNQDIGIWDVSSVTDMSYTFGNAKSFNQDISLWDVSSVTDMSGMFSFALRFNSDISGWDVSSVTNMSYMFSSVFDNNADEGYQEYTKDYDFNGDLGSWDVSSVTNMEGMFEGANAFNQDISDWDVSAVTNMALMFYVANNFNGELNNWNVSQVNSMRGMFSARLYGLYDNIVPMIFNNSLDNWDVSAVENMDHMFAHSYQFDQSLGNWNVSAVESMKGMFNSVTLSTEHYDEILINWGELNVKQNVIFDAGDSQFSGAAKAAREALKDGNGWKIYDNGREPSQ